MPAKRRMTSEPALAQEPKRRVTRSSTKADASTAQVPAMDDSTTERKGSKTKRKAQAKGTTTTPKANTTTPKSKSTKPKPKAEPKPKHKPKDDTIQEPKTSDPSLTAQNPTPYTITSPTLKSPLQCHSYPARNPPHPRNSSPSTLIFTHGAGGTLSAPAVVNFCTGYSTLHPIRAFQGSMNLASRVKGFHACLENLRRSSKEEGEEEEESKRKKKGKEEEDEDEVAGKRVVLGGRSMGARAAVIAATELLDIQPPLQLHLILASYPLKGPKNDIRDSILLALPSSPTVDVLFIVGDRDAMCPLDLLESIRGKMKAKSRVVVIRGADHGMHVRPKGREREVGVEAGRRAAAWVAGEMEGEGDVVVVGEEEEEDNGEG